MVLPSVPQPRSGTLVPQLLGLATVGAVLAASAVVAQAGWRREFLALAVLATLPVLLRWPGAGLVALVGGALAVPFSIGTGTETSLNLAVLLVGLLTVIWILGMVAQRRIGLYPSSAIAPLLALVAVAVLAFIAGTQPWLYDAETASLPAQAGGLGIVLLSACAFLLAGHVVQSERWLHAMVIVFVSLAALLVGGYVVPGAGSISRLLLGTTQLGSMFWIWVVAITFSQAAFNRELAVLWRLALGAVLLATLYVGFLVQHDWTSGWLPPLVVLLAIVVARAPRLIPLMVLAGGIAALLGSDKLASFVMGGDNEYSLMTRVEAWRVLGQVIAINPILGLGFANYSSYTTLFPILGYYVRFNSHNNYVDIVAQMGVMGLLCYLWFAWAVARLAWRLREATASGFARAYVYGAFGGVMGMLAAGMLGDWVLPYVYNVGLSGFRISVLGWVFLGGLLLVEHRRRTGQAAQSEVIAT